MERKNRALSSRVLPFGLVAYSHRLLSKHPVSPAQLYLGERFGRIAEFRQTHNCGLIHYREVKAAHLAFALHQTRYAATSGL